MFPMLPISSTIRRSYPRSVRVRLTLWYTGAMIVVLGVYVAGVFAFVSNQQSRGLDARLWEDFHWPAEMLEILPEGKIGTLDDSAGVDSGPWLEVWRNGELLYSTWVAQHNPVPRSDELAAQADNRIVSIPDPPVRLLSGKSTIGGQDVVFLVARPEAPMQADLRNLLFVLLLGLPFGVAAAGLGGYSLARRALAPVDRMAERAHWITAERLSARLPVDNPNDELGRLATVFNDTLTRLEASFDHMRRFTSDASHELRTPLTAMRSVGEVGLRGRRDERAYRQIIGSMLEEVDRLAYLVDRLLTMSRADSGEALLASEVFDLGELCREVVAQMEVLAEEKRQTIALDCHGAPHWIGDRLVLRQALFNIVDNAVKYTPEGGRIDVCLRESDGNMTIDVSDTGPGIPPELQPRVFDRFFRVDKSRSRANGGTGLGLSIAKWAVEVNGGRLSMETPAEAQPGSGSTFRITLPRTPAAEPAKSLQAV